jgi:hypothetical protein
MKALAAGKHVLLEKPIASTVEETKAMFDLAERKGLVLMEGFHYRGPVLTLPSLSNASNPNPDLCPIIQS